MGRRSMVEQLQELERLVESVVYGGGGRRRRRRVVNEESQSTREMNSRIDYAIGVGIQKTLGSFIEGKGLPRGTYSIQGDFGDELLSQLESGRGDFDKLVEAFGDDLWHAGQNNSFFGAYDEDCDMDQDDVFESAFDYAASAIGDWFNEQDRVENEFVGALQDSGVTPDQAQAWLESMHFRSWKDFAKKLTAEMQDKAHNEAFANADAFVDDWSYNCGG